MKNAKLLLLIPAFLLSSCGENYGKEITPEEATPKLNAILSKEIDTDRMNLVVKQYTAAYDANKKQKATLDTDIIIQSGKVKQFKSKVSSNGASVTTEATRFADVRYSGGEVFYLSVSDGKVSQKRKLTKSNTQYTQIDTKVKELELQIKEVVHNMQDPLTTLSRKDLVKGSISGFLFNYYAKGEDDLTIKSTPQSSEVTGYFNATYINAVIYKYDYKFTTKDGTYIQEKYTLDFDKHVDVPRPSDYDKVPTL